MSLRAQRCLGERSVFPKRFVAPRGQVVVLKGGGNSHVSIGWERVKGMRNRRAGKVEDVCRWRCMLDASEVSRSAIEVGSQQQ